MHPGLKDGYAGMLDLYPIGNFAGAMPKPKGDRDFVEEVGKGFSDTLCGLRDHIAFLGELAVASFKTLLHPGSTQ